MGFFIRFIYTIFVIYLFGLVMPNVDIGNFYSITLFLITLGVLNGLVFPIVKLLTFPINFITLGLFNFLLNIMGLYIALNTITDAIKISGSSVVNFFTVLLLAFVLSIPANLSN